MSLPPPDPSSVVVVTGASSGIGTELARALAQRGYPLLLIARRADRLEALAAELRAAHGVDVTVRPCDLGDADQRTALVAELAELGAVGLCNCAGFGTTGKFHALALDREREQVAVNVSAVLELTHTVLPRMVARGAGAVLNVASIAAFQPMPSMATYAASKGFVVSFSAAVQEELRGTGVSVTALCPGPVPTEWADIADAQELGGRLAEVSAENVAAAGVAGMEKGKREVVPGLIPLAMSLPGRLVPRSILMPALGASLRRSES